MSDSAVSIHPVTPSDYADWCTLYQGYAAFYRQPMTPDILQQTWQWLQQGKLHGALARTAAGHAAGLAHWEFILRPLRGAQIAYLHDLYVHSHLRSSGVGSALLAHFQTEALAHGCTTVRWLTKQDNLIARALYDKNAEAASEWVLYQQVLEAQ